jgi:hypothetical protein
MISKNTVQSFVNKYYLGETHNSVVWEIKDNTLSLEAGDSSSGCCRVKFDNFMLDDVKLPIFDTGKLNKFLGALTEDLVIEVEKNVNSIPNKLKLADSNFDLEYQLAAESVIPNVKVPTEKGLLEHNEIDLNDMVADITNEDVSRLLKAKSALPDNDTVFLKTNTDLDGNYNCELMYGADNKFSDKISYQLSATFVKPFDFELPFNVNIFSKILSANKDMESGKIKLSKKGVIQISFTSNDMYSEYYMTRKETIN